jgi:hypothetical protein
MYARKGRWFYDDNNMPYDPDRACNNCGMCPNNEHMDSCMGYVPGALMACCGHGQRDAYIVFHDGLEVQTVFFVPRGSHD